jgi:hypothetical protein
MMSERMQTRYAEAYDAFEETFKDTVVHIRHRSLKKYADKTNQDISFYINGKYICGVYVARNLYKFYLSDNDWYNTTSGELSERNEDDGWYSIHFENLDDCVQEVKAFFKKEYQVR